MLSETKSILVCGGGGFMGKSLIRALLKDSGWEIHAISRNNERCKSVNGVTWHSVDLLAPGEIDRVFNIVRPTHLVQLAWCAEHGTYWRDQANFDWLAANLHMAQAFVQNGGERCLFAGTSAEYDWSAVSPYHEQVTPLRPQLLYGGCKLASYHALSTYFEQERISWAWARVFCPFGPFEDRRRLIPKTCLRLIAGEDLELDSGESLRDFLHVEDIADALLAVIISDIQGAVNIASGEPVSVRQVVTDIARHLYREDGVHFAGPITAAHRAADQITADITRLRVEVGWTPHTSLNERLRQVCDWWKNITK